MRAVLNKTHRPLRVHLPQGRILHLGPHQQGRVTPQALDSAGVQKLVDSGDLEVLDDGVNAGSTSRDGGQVSTNTHGHYQDSSGRSRGDR